MSEEAIKTTTDEQNVDQAFQRLIDTYLASQHRKKVDIITKAFNFARQAHKGVKRLSGEPYIMHPIAVAQIASEEMGLGSTSICAALLHDVVEDTDYTIEDIENLFGPKIAQIVDGLTKISGGIFGDHASEQAENFKKLLLTMSDDIRVILIKICDRLHNMRTLEAQPPSKQYKIAGETLYLYAPLANRLGLNKIKTELENLSFCFEHPDTYDAIIRKLSVSQVDRDKLFENFTAPIREALDKMGINYTIKARVKSPYSIWNKMQNKHVTFDEIYDILAVRIIFTPKTREEEINECFKIYVAVSQLYKSHPDRLRDWLNHPKANGYQALHVTLMSKLGQWIEVQIRSDRMDELAEQGFAAHWKYKEGNGEANEEGELNNWIGTIKEILDDPQPDAMDFLDAIKLNLYAREIFVFTPKGEIITMPAGCTALDFAFQIHTFVGTHCIGAKVNHKLVPMSHKLQGGDQVEILTSKSQKVQPEWEEFITTAKARSKIQAALRRENREMQKNGETMLAEFMNEKDMEVTISMLDRLCEANDFSKHETLFIEIAKKNIALDDKLINAARGKNTTKTRNWRKYVPFLKSEKRKALDNSEGKLIISKDFNRKQALYINEENISQFNFPTCCHPIPGDNILGFIESNKQVTIHKRSCSVANVLKSSYGNRILDVRWDMMYDTLFDATIAIRGIDRKGILNDVTEIISKNMDVNIRSLSITSHDDIFDGKLELRVHNNEELNAIVNNLKKVDKMQEVVAL